MIRNHRQMEIGTLVRTYQDPPSTLGCAGRFTRTIVERRPLEETASTTILKAFEELIVRELKRP